MDLLDYTSVHALHPREGGGGHSAGCSGHAKRDVRTTKCGSGQLLFGGKRGDGQFQTKNIMGAVTYKLYLFLCCEAYDSHCMEHSAEELDHFVYNFY